MGLLMTHDHVVVVGSTGFVGRHVAAAIEARGIPVTRLRTPRLPPMRRDEVDHFLSSAQELIHEMAQAMTGALAVVNASGNPDASSRDEGVLTAANAAAAAVLAAAAREAGVRRFVHISSAVVQGDRKVLDESTEVQPFSPYSRSKALAEQLVLDLGPSQTVAYRPPSVHGPDRRITKAIRRLAASRLSATAAPGDAPTPQALIENVADAAAFLATSPASPPPIVIHPWEGLTTSSLLEALGDRRPWLVPASLARGATSAVNILARFTPPLEANRRRLELILFGQVQGPSWLTINGWVAPIGRDGWRALGNTPGNAQGARTEEVPYRFRSRKVAHANGTERHPQTAGGPSRGRILYGVTVPSVANSFLRGQLAFMSEMGWEVYLGCSPGHGLDTVREREGVTVIELPTAREVSLVSDLRSLTLWFRLIRRLRPDVLNASTPKAALLSLLAARALRVPRRVYVVRGLRLEAETGVRRAVLLLMERVTIACATDVVAVSRSLADEMRALGLTRRSRPVVIANGSSNGVDAVGIRARAAKLDRAGCRRELGLPDDDTFVIAFIGRARRDKGIVELIAAMNEPRLRDAVLVTAGNVEEPAINGDLQKLGRRWVHLGWVDDVTSILVSCDVLCLPTHREGFPNVVLEAAAIGRPAVTTSATGARDSVINGETGFVVPVKDSPALAGALARLAENDALRTALGAAAQARAMQDFQPVLIWQGLNAVYTGGT